MRLAERIQRVTRRSRAFFQAREPGHFLVHAYVPAQEEPATRPLTAFTLADDLEDWLDYRLEIARATWRAREGLDDDHIPSLSPQFGMAEYSAWLGMDVQHQEDTCLPVPMVREPGDLARLDLNGGARWYDILRRGYAHLRRRQGDAFVIAFGGMIGPMDMANAVHGDAFYENVLDNKPFMHALLAAMVRASLWFHPRLVGWCDCVDGGYVYQFGGFWLPGARPGHLTNDPAMMCSLAVYREFGLPYERQLAAYYDGSLYHVHNARLHLVPDVATLPGLRVLQISNDPKIPPVPETLPALYALTPPGLPLMMHATSDQIRTHLPTLRQRNICLRVPCRDRADADAIVALVRRESRPLA